MIDFPEIDVLAQDLKDNEVSVEDAYDTLMNRYGDRHAVQIEKALDTLYEEEER